MVRDLPRIVTLRWLEDFPDFLRPLCIDHGAWVVGSAAQYIIGVSLSDSKPRDWDVLVPLTEWPKACRLVPWKAVANSFGGYKIEVQGIKADVWPDDLNSFIAKATAYTTSPNIAIQPATSTVLVFGKRRDDSHR